MAHEAYTFECKYCNNLNTRCPAVLVNKHSTGYVHNYAPLALRLIQKNRMRAVDPAELKLLCVSLARRSPPLLFALMAKFPLSVAPLFCEIEHELAPADMTVQMQLALIESGVASRAVAGQLLRPIVSNRSVDVDGAVDAQLVRQWGQWVGGETAALPARWIQLICVALTRATPLPRELCVVVCSFMSAA